MKTLSKTLILFLLLMLIAACAAAPRPGTFADRVLNRPLPMSEAERGDECLWLQARIRYEYDELNRKAVFQRGMQGAVNRANFEEHLSVLYARSDRLLCTA